MAIDLYSGTPGSGKSLHLARVIYDTCNRKSDKMVICNFDVDTKSFKHPDRFFYIPNEKLDADLLIILGMVNIKTFKEYGKIQGSTILIIDECQLLFNARSWNEGGRADWIKFFTQHRKLGFYVILVAQFDQMIDKQIRALIENQYVHRKMSSMGFIAFLLKTLLRHDLFLCIETFYPLKLKTGQEFLLAKNRYTSIYNTCIIFDEFIL